MRDPDQILASLESWGVRLELDRVERLLEEFGQPQDEHATVLVAGTNGKGSTASLLASMTAAAGYRTGLFTSPHLEGVEERLRIDGVAIRRHELAELLAEIVDRAQSRGLEPPTYFEALTVAGRLWFTRAGVEIAVFEVGMGGRLDATNVCTPVLSLVSEIGLDHVKPLGNTLREIAGEKAGIFRSGVTALSSAGEAEALGELEARARRVGANFQHVSDRLRRVESAQGTITQSIAVETATETYELELMLPGEHQVRNLLLALAAAEDLAGGDWPRVNRTAVERGVRECFWPGRLERIVLPDGKIVWLDVAHNPQGAETLARFLAEHLPTYDLLAGILEDKDARGVLEAVTRGADKIILTRPDSARAVDPATLAGWLPGRKTKALGDADEALDAALAGSRPLLVCGSLYLVGWVRRALRERFGVPAPAADPAGAGEASLGGRQS